MLIIEYADPGVAVTHLRVGAEKLAGMEDSELLEYWNELLAADDAFRKSRKYVATEIPFGKSQVELSQFSGTWIPRGHVLRCVWNEYDEDKPDEPCVTIDDRDYTLAEFGRLLSTFAGWGMRIEFVPHDALHERPKIKVREPRAGVKKRKAIGKR